MPPALQLHNGFVRLPVTALAACGALLVAGEGPYLRFYHAKDSRYIASKRVFKAQAVHGVAVYSDHHNNVIKLVIWGGRLIRALEVSFTETGYQEYNLDVCMSEVTKASDWILDLAPCFGSLDEIDYERGTCIAVTAHNALVQITVNRQIADSSTLSIFKLSATELTSSSRSILYSAHVFCESKDCVLVAAGTAFGEILYWSWGRELHSGSISRVHRVFLGHEGSIFGVRISKELPSGCCQNLKRIIASCSDDRTIRIWDVSDVIIQSGHSSDTQSARTHHTGFSNAAFDPKPFSSSECLAIGWGHASRVWTVQFLDIAPCEGKISLFSTGEDASSRTWNLSLNYEDGATFPYKLLQQDCAAYHNGKNIWSSVVYEDVFKRPQVVCGAADSKITTYALTNISEKASERKTYEYTVHDVLSLVQNLQPSAGEPLLQHDHKSSKKAEFFRSYCFLDDNTFLLTTNSGKVLISSLQAQPMPPLPSGANGLYMAAFIDQPKDLLGYSTCVSEPTSGVAFIAGSVGSIYVYSTTAGVLSMVGFVDGKIGEMFTMKLPDAQGQETVVLLVTLVGRAEAQLFFVDIAANTTPHISRIIKAPVADAVTGSIITSMIIASGSGSSFLCLGFRRGSIAVYAFANDQSASGNNANLLKVIERVHGVETVTALEWVASSEDISVGHLISVGRDGRLAVQSLNLQSNSVELVHSLPLPIGPNIEGLYFLQGHLLVHGFSSKKWVLYDVTVEEEIMSVETGGAHRSWSFQPHPKIRGYGTLVWTRASSMHICMQTEPNHRVIRPGGHGREIKAVAVSQGSSPQLIATGAEDTDIKIFEYADGEMLCRRTLRRHTTGIQHLQWSEDNNYLFSSGGCEEFYIWRIRRLPSFMDIGVVCECTYVPESEHSDLRIMSFDVMKYGSGYHIAMVFSDSSIKVYRYSPAGAVKWQALAKGLYSTSCLTQCVFLSPESIVTAGTDGHTAIWPLSSQAASNTADARHPVLTMSWEQPIRIHQSSSKAMASLDNDEFSEKLIVSAGDDGGLAVLNMAHGNSTLSLGNSHLTAPVIRNRAHASAITACAILRHQARVFVLTAGNDEWVRLWEVHVGLQDGMGCGTLGVESRGKIKTCVADVSGMDVLEAKESEPEARVVICGVGMEIVRVEWDD
ncbi:WD40-repeat-containing domain protein [Phaeosphaeriaceae sp. PMI808]|nr:WD40-repeat-containing domain protein [Phaeosphaeriaceae sp. PMI808]